MNRFTKVLTSVSVTTILLFTIALTACQPGFNNHLGRQGDPFDFDLMGTWKGSVDGDMVYIDVTRQKGHRYKATLKDSAKNNSKGKIQDTYYFFITVLEDNIFLNFTESSDSKPKDKQIFYISQLNKINKNTVELKFLKNDPFKKLIKTNAIKGAIESGPFKEVTITEPTDKLTEFFKQKQNLHLFSWSVRLDKVQ